MPRKAKASPEAIASSFALLAPIGTPCRYYPVLPCAEDDFHVSAIRSQPWVLGHGDVVVAIEGFSGGKSIKHIMIVRPANAA